VLCVGLHGTSTMYTVVCDDPQPIYAENVLATINSHPLRGNCLTQFFCSVQGGWNNPNDFVLAYHNGASWFHDIERQEFERFAKPHLNKNGDNTRCWTTEYSIIHLLCGRKQAESLEYSSYDLIELLDRLHNLFTDGVFPSLVFSMTLTQSDLSEVGHVWVVHSFPNGTYDWYQSFINQYTLKQWIDNPKFRDGKNSPLSYEALRNRLLMIKSIENAAHYEDVYKNYSLLFDYALSYESHGALSDHWSTLYKIMNVKNTKIKFFSRLACILEDNYSIETKTERYRYEKEIDLYAKKNDSLENEEEEL